jgi:ribosomal protein S11
MRSAYFIVVRRSYRNVFVTLVRSNGQVLFSFSGGRILAKQQRRRVRVFNRSRRSGLPVFCSLIKLLIRKMRFFNVRRVSVVLFSFPDFMIKVFFQFLRDHGIRVVSVVFRLSGPHNGCKKHKVRRI